jgi:hypothetical protein
MLVLRDNQQPLVHLHGQAQNTLLQIQFTNSDPEKRKLFSIKKSPKRKMISGKMMLQNCQHNFKLFLIL